jgi:uncharacterized membrane protein
MRDKPEDMCEIDETWQTGIFYFVQCLNMRDKPEDMCEIDETWQTGIFYSGIIWFWSIERLISRSIDFFFRRVSQHV